ncbi:MAG: BTAD domain-containing putative transcriptional regulator [Candidatus Sericytochromatia bacterium]|nr:BTAD domain-containing putative transcriptional regulator [Candidatus Sericytochromatia bacterium]
MPLFGEDLVTRTKFVLPTPRRSHLGRARLDARLETLTEARLGLVVAAAGYGKSSLVAAHVRARGVPTIWYELSERDADAQTFAVHLAHAAHRAHPGAAGRMLTLLAAPGGAERHGEAAIEALADAWLDRLTAETWLVLDDFHRVAGSGVTALVGHLVRHAPPNLRVVLTARTPPELPDLPRWRLAGEVVTIGQADLAFTPEELTAWLAAVHGLDAPPEAVAALLAETEGWPMALPLVAGRLQASGPGSGLPGHEDLFGYLAAEALSRLEPALVAFLFATAPLERLEPGVCATLARLPGGAAEAQASLRALHDHGLFLISLEGQAYRHHHLMREFLLARLAEQGQLAVARQAAAHALATHGEPEEAIVQLLAAGAHEPAIAMMALLAPDLVDQGRGGLLAAWAGRLPQASLDVAPALLVGLGDAARLAAAFEDAIGWYERARRAYGDAAEGRSRASAGLALVYLDTARPTLAEPHLEAALADAEDPRRRSELLVLMAENRLNRGDAAGALALFADVREALPDVTAHEGRLRLRLGRLAEARAILHGALGAENAEAPSRAHREPALVLAFVEALAGDAPAAERAATAGLERARRQQAAWAEAVGLMRRGHAHVVAGRPEAAEQDYAAALALAEAIGVARLRAEPLFGRALLAARRGDGDVAEALAAEAAAIAEGAGDGWVVALTALAVGAGWCEAGDRRAGPWLARARAGFEACQDAFGQACVALAAARTALRDGDEAGFAALAAELAERVRQEGHGFLVTGPTLMGFPDATAAQRFVQAAQRHGIPPTAWQAAPGEAPSAPPPAPAPDAPLRLQALGRFRVWLAGQELGERVWGREKARQLLHLLIAARGQTLSKARILDTLWPEADPGTADGAFRVVLNALNKALEPDRAAGAPSRFVLRSGGGYGLAGPPEVALDVAAFEDGLDAAAAMEAQREPEDRLLATYRAALERYEGPFLQAFTSHEAWCDRERERLAHRFAEGSLRLARLLSARGEDAGCIDWCSRLLALEPLTEEAHRLLMVAYYRQGDRAAALRTYDRCVVLLSDELDIDPMPETQRVAKRIEAGEPVEA